MRSATLAKYKLFAATERGLLLEALGGPVRIMLVCGHSPRCVRGRFTLRKGTSRWQAGFAPPQDHRDVAQVHGMCR
jgi:hypothetical protein